MKKVAVFWVAVVLWSLPLRAKEFVNPEKGYAFQYDEAVFEVVAPGFLTTDAVVRKKEGENGFFPNLVVISRPVADGFTLEQELARAKTEYGKIFPELRIEREEAFAFKGYPGYLVELSYTRDAYQLFLRSIFLKTPRLFMNLNLTSPLASRDANLASFLNVLNALDLNRGGSS
jgi:hypothetical protein